jgi:hypothetical protein
MTVGKGDIRTIFLPPAPPFGGMRMEWKPIEEAPRDEDGPNLLLCRFIHPEDYPASITVGFWSTIDAHAEEKRLGWCDWCAGLSAEDYWTEFHPTHFMPLPDPPG